MLGVSQIDSLVPYIFQRDDLVTATVLPAEPRSLRTTASFLADPGISDSMASTAPLTRPLAAPDRTGAGGRITPRQNFRTLDLLLVSRNCAQRSPRPAAQLFDRRR